MRFEAGSAAFNEFGAKIRYPQHLVPPMVSWGWGGAEKSAEWEIYKALEVVGNTMTNDYCMKLGIPRNEMKLIVWKEKKKAKRATRNFVGRGTSL